jgi:hypothetical protein
MPTLTQSETLRVGERGPFIPDPVKFKKLITRAKVVGFTVWVEKRKTEITEADKTLRLFIDLPRGYKIVYGITWKGRDYEAGDSPRDLSVFTRGMTAALGIGVLE